MKYGILGLRPRQIADFKSRGFTGHFDYLPADKVHSPATLRSFCDGVDTVIVTPSVTANTLRHVPREKRSMVTGGGGVSAVVTHVEALTGEVANKPQSSAKPSAKPKASVKPHTPAPVKPVVTPAKPSRVSHSPFAVLGGLMKQAKPAQDPLALIHQYRPRGCYAEYTRPGDDVVGIELRVKNYSNPEAEWSQQLVNAMAMATPGVLHSYRIPAFFNGCLPKLVRELDLVATQLFHGHRRSVMFFAYPERVDIEVVEVHGQPEGPIGSNGIVIAPIELEVVKAKPSTYVRDTPIVIPKLETRGYDRQSQNFPKSHIASDVPEGWSSQYVVPEDGLKVQRPDAQGRIRYTVLRGATPGQVFRFARPPHTDLATWRTRVTTARHYWWNHNDVLTEAHFYRGHVDLLVMDPKGLQVTKHVPAEPTAPPAPVPTDASPSAQQFWESAYLAAIAGGSKPDDASFAADAALAHHQKRFQR